MISAIQHSASRKARSRFLVQVAWDSSIHTSRKTGIFAPNLLFLKRSTRSSANRSFNGPFDSTRLIGGAEPRLVLERRLGLSTVACVTIQ